MARLGKKNYWWSVEQYNDAYREAHAVDEFAWGKGLHDLRDSYPENNTRKESNPQSQAGGISKFGGNRKTVARRDREGILTLWESLQSAMTLTRQVLSTSVHIHTFVCSVSPSDGLGSHPK